MSRNGRGAGCLGNTRTELLALATSTPTNLEEKVRRRLEKQQDHLFTFLDVEEVDATNNLAERQLRPAVISRARSRAAIKRPRSSYLEILTSLAATCVQQAESFAHLVSQNAVLSPAR